MLTQAREIIDGEALSDGILAEVLCRLGEARIKLGSTHVAISLLTEAYRLLENSSVGGDSLLANILAFRSIGYQRVGDVEAARDDA